MQLTSNLNLKKPGSTDNVNIDDLNGNADILDAEVTKLASTTEAGRMSAADKSKLNGITAGAQVNTVSSVAGKTGAVTLAKADVGLGNVDNVQQAPLTHVGTGGTAHAAATTAAAGFMSAADKSKLDGIASGANNYTHPANHPPSIITQDANNRFMTDVERTKLGGIATGAQVNRVIATQAQAEAGTDNATDMTPLRVSQAVAAVSTSIATPNKIIQRDGSGRAQVAAPIVAADIARKDTVDNAIANVVRDAGAIVNNTNFNTITNVGIYKLGIISDSANRPPATADYGLLEVFVSSDYLIQRYTEIVSGLTYQRTRYDGAAWTAWTSVSTNTRVVNGALQYLDGGEWKSVSGGGAPSFKYPTAYKNVGLSPGNAEIFDMAASDTHIYVIMTNSNTLYTLNHTNDFARADITMNTTVSGNNPHMFYKQSNDRLYAYMGQTHATPFGWINKTTGAFTALAQCPYANKKATYSAFDGDDLMWFVFGTNTWTGVDSAVYQYRISTNTWSLVVYYGNIWGGASVPPFDMVYLKDKHALFFIGGSGVNSSNSVIFHLNTLIPENINNPFVNYLISSTAGTMAIQGHSCYSPDGRHVVIPAYQGVAGFVFDTVTRQYWVIPGMVFASTVGGRSTISPSGKVFAHFSATGFSSTFFYTI
ncbi:hypothetical protein PAT3040_06129 [Paenibacillus agaridevorans]|uniref:Uncharacterized protein n=1 Tax=Paenibacillus agaridevorans TaxID=171404 RepID=A0A2R5F1H9_9BACL|nr:pyocin knob domain-containing protein [Paenibacillus agaridevorans]GBG11328.1 hypothetical protein PAT3040_06129 [Paenibacillus agaridevorans]